MKNDDSDVAVLFLSPSLKAVMLPRSNGGLRLFGREAKVKDGTSRTNPKGLSAQIICAGNSRAYIIERLKVYQ